jgi:hypothetical protein
MQSQAAAAPTVRVAVVGVAAPAAAVDRATLVLLSTTTVVVRNINKSESAEVSLAVMGALVEVGFTLTQVAHTGIVKEDKMVSLLRVILEVMDETIMDTVVLVAEDGWAAAGAARELDRRETTANGLTAGREVVQEVLELLQVLRQFRHIKDQPHLQDIPGLL